MAVRVVLVLALALALAACGAKKSSKVTDAAPAPVAVTDAYVPPPLLDRRAEATEVLLRWNQPDAPELMHRTAHERFRKAVSLDEFRIFHGDFSARVGNFMAVKTADAVKHTTKDQQVEDVIRGVATFERGDAGYELVLTEQDGKPAMVLFRLELPPALRQPANRDEARKLAVAFRDAVLAVDVAKIDELSLPRIRGQLGPADAPRLKEAIAALGGGRKVTITRDEACGDDVHCVTYRVAGAAGRANLTVTVSAPLGRWRVVDWSFDPDQPNKETAKP